jgi:hypothetical protein
MAVRVRNCAESRIKNNIPPLVIILVFRYTESVMVKSAQQQEQRQRYLKAKVAMALYSEYGRVPKEKEIDEVYHLTRVLYKAVLGTHFLRKQQERTGQLALF